MKKLSKLQINSEKLMKNEELVELRGGYGCACLCYNWSGQLVGAIGGVPAQYCFPECAAHFGGGPAVYSC